MLTLHIEDIEEYDESIGEFIMEKPGGTFRFEHTLLAISEWESIWQIPYFTADFTPEQELHYYKLMCLDPIEDYHFTSKVTSQIVSYINDKRTATTIQNDGTKSSSTTITSEVVYAMMASAHVPFECERWNFNRLLMMLRVVAEQQSPKKKMSQQEILQQNAKLNAQRKAEHNTKG